MDTFPTPDNPLIDHVTVEVDVLRHAPPISCALVGPSVSRDGVTAEEAACRHRKGEKIT